MRIYLKRPEYLFNPHRIFKRLFRTRSKIETCQTAWGTTMEVNTEEAIGNSIFFTGIYDLALTEILWKLIRPGNVVVDIGANIGYTVGVCSLRAGEKGMVHAFEPNEFLFDRLKFNISKMPFTNVKLHAVALSDSNHVARLVLPSGYQNNEGVAFVGDEGAQGIEIQLECLDNVLQKDTVVDVLKIDVEGHEYKVFMGAKELLRQKRIRNIVFEDHDSYPSDVATLLTQFGYKVYRIEKGWFSLKLMDPTTRSSVSFWEPTNYLATLDETEIMKSISGGYECLA